MRVSLIFFVVLAAMRTSSQPVSGDTVQRIAAVFKKWDGQNTPGAMFAISRHGEVIYANAWGMADIESKIPNSPTTSCSLASLSKQFTAAAILLLEKQGKLSLEDDIRKYLPCFSNRVQPIRIRHLLNHTSGLQDWTQMLMLTNENSESLLNNDSIINLVCQVKEVNNNPGDEMVYNNTNYSLLASIVEKCSGISFPEFCEKNFFVPLNLTHTWWALQKPKGPVAFTYQAENGHYSRARPNRNVLGHAGLFSTVYDLLKWNAAYQSAPFGKSFLEKQLRQGKLNNGVTTMYASGLRIAAYKGNKVITHDGAGPGNTSFLEYYPEYDMSFALIANTADLNAILTTRQVADLFIKPKDKPRNDSGKLQYNQIPSKDLTGFEGYYKNSRTGAGLQLVAGKDFLLTQNRDTLFPLGGNSFKIQQSTLTFTGDPERPVMLINSTFHPDTVVYNRASPSVKDSTSLLSYTGKYFSKLLKTSVSVLVQDGILKLKLSNGKIFDLLPVYKDGFDLKPRIINTGNAVYFTRNESAVSTMHIVLERARNVVFEKMD